MWKRNGSELNSTQPRPLPSHETSLLAAGLIILVLGIKYGRIKLLAARDRVLAERDAAQNPKMDEESAGNDGNQSTVCLEDGVEDDRSATASRTGSEES